MTEGASAFAPIAVVGRDVLLPGATSVEAFAHITAAGRPVLRAATTADWRVSPELTRPGLSGAESCASSQGGYVPAFELLNDLDGVIGPDPSARDLDPVFLWLLRVCARALAETQFAASSRAGLVVGNLSYPSAALAEMAERAVLERASAAGHLPSGAAAHLGLKTHPALSRFSSGAPALWVADRLNLKGAPVFALDAACASSLYALDVACRALQTGRADVMLAAGLNRADDLFLHTGFTALQALSPSGRSLPFGRAADGLVPAEGAACVVLKRLEDARRDGDTIHGVIRGIGLSNDGAGRGFLVPEEDGQVRAMRAAYTQAGIAPQAVQFVDCHATGTLVGDAVELRSLAHVFGADHPLVLGALKGVIGHTITASGLAALIRTLEAMKESTFPVAATAGAAVATLDETAFDLPAQARPWTAPEKIAAISSFGFGGNNAHVVVSAAPDATWPASTPVPRRLESEPVAIVAMGAMAGTATSVSDMLARLTMTPGEAPDDVPSGLALAVQRFRFPPKDLEEALGQQLALLCTTEEAVAATALPASDRVGVFIGMGCDVEHALSGLRLRLRALQPALARLDSKYDADWLARAEDCLSSLTAARVIGTMPNIPANRLNRQWNWSGPGFTVSAEGLSGVQALDCAIQALRNGTIDAAVVGAAEFAGGGGGGADTLHRATLCALTGCDVSHGSAAFTLVIKRSSDAHAAGDKIIGVIDDVHVRDESPDANNTSSIFARRFGYAHAASGLAEIVTQALGLASRQRLRAEAEAVPWLARAGHRRTRVTVPAFQNGPLSYRQLTVDLRDSFQSMPAPAAVDEGVAYYAAADRAALKTALREDRQGGEGPVRLALVTSPARRDAVRSQALAQLEKAPTTAPGGQMIADGVFLCDAPMHGDLAFLFTGSGTAYPTMGRGLARRFPAFLDKLAARFPGMEREIEDLLLAENDESGAAGLADPLTQAKGNMYLSLLHAAFTRDVLGLKPQAAIGVSGGETNALLALGVWSDMAGLLRDLRQHELYSRHLGGPMEALRAAWGAGFTQWTCWHVRAPAARVQALADLEPCVQLMIISSPEDCLIGGDALGCERVLAELAPAPALRVAHNMVSHCPALTSVAAPWRAAHTRATEAVEGVRFYSNAIGDFYTPDAETCADMLTRQATNTVDVPRTIRKAYADGIRIFIEHGPRAAQTHAVGKILGDQPHLVVPLDRAGQDSARTALCAAARLWVAGVAVDLKVLGLPAPRANGGVAARRFALARDWPLLPPPTHADAVPIAPHVAPAVARSFLPGLPAPQFVQAHNDDMPAVVQVAMSPVGAYFRQVADLHRAYLANQQASHARYLAVRQEIQARAFASGGVAHVARTAPQDRTHRPAVVPSVTSPTAIDMPRPLRQPVGPSLDRRQLETLASGKISDVFGPLFAQQDAFARQIRMPEPPLLLVDAVLGIDAKPLSMETGTLWTRTKVTADSWYLHRGRVPPGILIETGQADLLLISWLGADRLNQGDRVYRLLGCELTFHGAPPEADASLTFEIRITGHAQSGDTRLFFFNYDCWNGDQPVLSVRNGQAGFFSDAELNETAGALWDAAADAPLSPARIETLPCPSRRQAFSAEQVRAFLAGEAFACFGAGFERAAAHTDTPRISGGRLALFDAVAVFAPTGGPWGRGYLKAEKAVTPDDWYFKGHFKNDPCMPGTLMANAAVDGIAFFIAAAGYTITRDGWIFAPVPGAAAKFLCRGQVTPEARHITYELFIEEVFVDETDEGPRPTVFAAILAWCDGVKVFHCRRFGLRLIPDFPAERESIAQATPVFLRDDVRGDRSAMIACANGRPSMAFGQRFLRYDQGRANCPRLPGAPYHFVSRILSVDAPPAAAKAGTRLVAGYEPEAGAWYFGENGAAVMPFAVLTEVSLQPCGWLACYAGFSLESDETLYFRNLDGTATQFTEVLPEGGVLRTDVVLTRFARMPGVALVFFEVTCTQDGRKVMTMETSFGFFTAAGLANQVGLPATDAEKAAALATRNCDIILHNMPPAYFSGTARLPTGRLRLLDRVVGWWPNGGASGCGRVLAERDVSPTDWYFRAHFFNDPVQPGSLGLECLLQTLQWAMLEQGFGAEIASPRFEAVACDEPFIWRYRGQIPPGTWRVTAEVDIIEVRRAADGSVVCVATGALWRDDLRIYRVERMAMRLKPAHAALPYVDADRYRYLADHCPSYAVPTAPMMQIAAWIMEGARRAIRDQRLIGLRDLTLSGWLTLDQPQCINVDVHVDTGEKNARLLAGPSPEALKPVATAKLLTAECYPDAPLMPATPSGCVAVDLPYANGEMFHGPAFHLLRHLRRGLQGAEALVRFAEPGATGVLAPVLLDAIFHAVPCVAPQLWAATLPQDVAVFPARVNRIDIFAPPPVNGFGRIVVRPLQAAARTMTVEAFIGVEDRCFVRLEVTMAAFPTGPFGKVAPLARQRFLRDRQYVENLGVSRVVGNETRLNVNDVRVLDWLPGTIAHLYALPAEQSDIWPQQVAVKDHMARIWRVHPSEIVAEVAGEVAQACHGRTGAVRACRLHVEGGVIKVMQF